MRFAKWKQYIHPDWSELRQSGARHYFKAIDLSEERRHIQDLEEELEITLPADLLTFYREIGIGRAPEKGTLPCFLPRRAAGAVLRAGGGGRRGPMDDLPPKRLGELGE